MEELAKNIAAIIADYPGCSAAVIRSDCFSGVDLLPACAFFLGCEKPGPSSFSHLEAFLGHVNLAGRFCGIFSSNAKACKYLSSLVRDSEAAAGRPFLAKAGTADRDKLYHWIQGILPLNGEKNEYIQS
jgi:hypothetical protein